MSARFCHRFFSLLFALVIGGGLFCAAASLAQTNGGPTTMPPARPTAAAAVVPAPPLPSISQSPVGIFRDLLKLPAAECEKQLSNRPPETRRRILLKLREYIAMKPDERELRLRVTELRWYFTFCMNLSPEERSRQLALLPAGDRALIQQRLELWDHLSADEKSDILQYEKTMEQFAGQNLTADRDALAVANRPLALGGARPMSPAVAAADKALILRPAGAQPADLQNLDNFLRLPVGQRVQLCSSFQRFFELSDEEKQKTLGELPDSERSQAVGSLQSIAKMSPEDRARFLEALRKFSTMNAAERAEFFKNAERWHELPTPERAAWRTLVNRLKPQPPLPPGLLTPPLPPLPPPSHVTQNLPIVTNGS